MASNVNGVTLMLTPITLPPPAVPGTSQSLYVLVIYARGKLLAIASLEKLKHTPFPVEEVQLIAGATGLPDTVARAALAQPSGSNREFPRLVESALKRLCDLAYLGEHPLTKMRLVESRLAAQGAVSGVLARARILRALLQEAIEQLRPVGALPASTSVPRQDWQPYLIFDRAYIAGEPNNSIMNWLQIGEGTFNRTRRRALHLVATVLLGMERREG